MWIEPNKETPTTTKDFKVCFEAGIDKGKREAQKEYEAKIKQLELENQLLRDTLSYYY